MIDQFQGHFFTLNLGLNAHRGSSILGNKYFSHWKLQQWIQRDWRSMPLVDSQFFVSYAEPEECSSGGKDPRANGDRTLERPEPLNPSRFSTFHCPLILSSEVSFSILSLEFNFVFSVV